MKTATAKELRQNTAALLTEVRRGREVVITYRGRSIAVLAPIGSAKPAGLKPVGFGMWQGRSDMRNVQRWLDDKRSPRHGK